MNRSAAELLLAVQMERAAIPFEEQFRFAPPRRWRADYVLFDAILVEVDGATWTLGRHNRPSSIAAEYEKGAAAAIGGYRVIHCTTDQVNDGTCLAWIRQALGMEPAA